MKLGEMGLDSPKLGGRGMGSSVPPSSKLMSKAPSLGRDLGSSSIVSSASSGAPPVKNLGSKIISALRARRRGMGAPRGGRRL